MPTKLNYLLYITKIKLFFFLAVISLLKMDHIEQNDSLAEDESEIVLCFFCMA